jgi:amidohydrolase
VEAIAGLHVGIFPELEKGRFGTRKGTVMASVTFFDVTFRGKGTHGAMPHMGTDSLLAACQFVAGLQAVRYASTSPVQPTVISIGSIHAGTAQNVIPEMGVASGTMRATSVQGQQDLEAHMAQFARGIALAHGVEMEIKTLVGAPLTCNSDAALPDLLAAAVAEAHGPDSFMWLPEPTLGGEDFGEYLMKIPGVFFFLGADIAAPHHHPRFNVAEDVLHRTVPVVDALLRKWAALH